MIGLIVAVGMVGAGQTAPAMPREQYGRCLNHLVQSKVSEKLAADAFKAAAKAACASEENTFRTAWIAYEVAMKTKRADAEQNANSQIDDYVQNAVETYEDMLNPK